METWSKSLSIAQPAQLELPRLVSLQSKRRLPGGQEVPGYRRQEEAVEVDSVIESRVLQLSSVIEQVEFESPV